jgi:hypothetical protein
MIETMESRLLLSGNQLNDSIYNLDAFQDYAVISQGNLQPTESSSSASAIPLPSLSSPTLNDVALVTNAPIPIFTNGAGYTISNGGVDPFAATWQPWALPRQDVGVPPAWDSFFDGAGVIVAVSDTGLETLQLLNAGPDYPILIHGTSTAGLLAGSVTDLSPGSTANLTYRDVQEVLVRSLRETSQYGVGVAVSDDLDWRASLSFSEVGSAVVYLSWDVDNNGQLTAGNGSPALVPSIDVPAQYNGIQFAGGTVRIEQLNSTAAGQGFLSAAIDAVAFIQPHGAAAAADTGAQGHVAPSGQLPRTGLSEIAPKSESDAKLAEAVDDLLAQDTILVDNSSSTGSVGSSAADNHQVLTATESAQPNGDLPVTGTVVVAALGGSTEGGMISVEALVDVASHAATASADEQASAAGNATPIFGELTRVAVMELIEGPADPAAPRPAAQHMLLATDAGTDVLRHAADHRSPQQTSTPSAIKIFAEQAGLAAATMAPVNPFYLATIVSAVSDAFASAALSLPSETLTPAALDGEALNAARSAAFSQWSDRQHGSGAAAHDDSNCWLDAVPLVTILACERVVAAKSRRQQQRHPNGRPAKAK